jgi:hypothetical protein
MICGTSPRRDCSLQGTRLRTVSSRLATPTRPQTPARKRALLWSLGGGVVTALAIPTLNTIISSIH